MKYLVILSALFCLVACSKNSLNRPDYVLVIHGGAGVMDKKDFTPELEKAYLDKLQEALDSGDVQCRQGIGVFRDGRK